MVLLACNQYPASHAVGGKARASYSGLRTECGVWRKEGMKEEMCGGEMVGEKWSRMEMLALEVAALECTVHRSLLLNK